MILQPKYQHSLTCGDGVQYHNHITDVCLIMRISAFRCCCYCQYYNSDVNIFKWPSYPNSHINIHTRWFNHPHGGSTDDDDNGIWPNAARMKRINVEGHLFAEITGLTHNIDSNRLIISRDDEASPILYRDRNTSQMICQHAKIWLVLRPRPMYVYGECVIACVMKARHIYMTLHIMQADQRATVIYIYEFVIAT